MALIDKYATRTEQIERRTLIFPMSDSPAIWEEVYSGGWRATRSGPYTDEKMFPKMDIERGLLIIERAK